MTALTKIEKIDHVLTEQFSTKESELLRDTICKDATPEEFHLFLNVCKMTGLNPFVKQIYPVKRWDTNLNRMAMTVQTGIDGLRLIAERTGKYCPGREPTFTYKDGKVFSATAYVKKLTTDGTWHEIARTAFYDEFCQSYKDKKTGQFKPTSFWDNMPHNQLAKCAETLCLKTAFPAETACVQTPDVMAQAYEPENKTDVKPLYMDEKKVISSAQAVELSDLLSKCSEAVSKNILGYIKKEYKIEMIDDLPLDEFEKYKELCKNKADEYQKKLAAEYQKKLAEAEMNNVNEEEVLV